MHRATLRADALKQEAAAKAGSLKLQLSQASGKVRDRVEDRMHSVRHARGGELALASRLIRAALSA